jgi:hypothetical protein
MWVSESAADCGKRRNVLPNDGFLLVAEERLPAPEGPAAALADGPTE